jgi:hypothetical protein
MSPEKFQLDTMRQAVDELEPSSITEVKLVEYIRLQDTRIRDLEAQVSRLNSDLMNKVTALQLTQKVKSSLATHVNRQREIIEDLERQMVDKPVSGSPKVYTPSVLTPRKIRSDDTARESTKIPRDEIVPIFDMVAPYAKRRQSRRRVVRAPLA